MFVDEWHGSQLISFLLYPLMKLFLTVSPDAEGMVLAFRHFYVVLNTLVCVLIYLSGRKISPPAALAAALSLMLFAPYSVRTLSYNSMGVLFVASACFAAAAQGAEKRNMLLCGLCFAAAVLCCPYLLIVFLLYCISVPVVYIISKKHGNTLYEKAYALKPTAFISFCVGAGIVLIVFCVFLLSRTGIGDLIENIPYVLSDPEHGSPDLAYDLKRFIGAFYRHSDQAPFVIFACAALLSIIAFDKGRKKRRALYMVFVVVLTAVYSLTDLESPNVNFFMFPLCVLGVFAFVLSENKQWKLLLNVFVPGWLYSLCMHFTSNQWYLAICLALSVSSAASVFFVAQLAKEIHDSCEKNGLKKVVTAAFAVLMALQLSVQLYSSVYHVDYEPPLWNLNTKIESGVQKGIVTGEAKAERYYAVVEDTDKIRMQTEGYCLYLSDDVWLLLTDKKPSAAYSGWLGYEYPEDSAKRLVDYWKLRPEKLPENIYVKDEFYYGFKDSIYGESIIKVFEPLGYTVEIGETGYFLKLK